MTTSTTSTPVTRTTAGLRTALLDELDALRGGSSNPSRANAIARLIGGTVETLRVELDVKRYLSGAGKDGQDFSGSVKLD